MNPSLPLGCRVQHRSGGYAGVVVRTEQRVVDFMQRIAPTGRDRWPELIAIAEAVRSLDGGLVVVCVDAPGWPLGFETLARPDCLIVEDGRDHRCIN